MIFTRKEIIENYDLSSLFDTTDNRTVRYGRGSVLTFNFKEKIKSIEEGGGNLFTLLSCSVVCDISRHQQTPADTSRQQTPTASD